MISCTVCPMQAICSCRKDSMHVNHITTSVSKRYVISMALIVVLVVSVFFATTVFNARAMQAHVSTKSSTVHRVSSTLVDLGRIGSAPPTDAQCRTKYSSPCYSPQEMRQA